MSWTEGSEEVVMFGFLVMQQVVNAEVISFDKILNVHIPLYSLNTNMYDLKSFKCLRINYFVQQCE